MIMRRQTSMEVAGNGVKKLVGDAIFGVYSGIMTKKYFTFLRRLQANGRSNMYGAVPYLMRTFELSREHAFAIVCEWIDLQPNSNSGTPSAELRHVERTRPPSAKRRKRSMTTT